MDKDERERVKKIIKMVKINTIVQGTKHRITMRKIKKIMSEISQLNKYIRQKHIFWQAVIFVHSKLTIITFIQQ